MNAVRKLRDDHIELMQSRQIRSESGELHNRGNSADRDHDFHNPAGIWESKPNIAAVGDSFAHGACVDSESNFVNRIRQRYPNTLNLGMGGNGPLLALAGIQEYLADLEPKLVLWFFFDGNDLDEVLRQIASQRISSE